MKFFKKKTPEELEQERQAKEIEQDRIAEKVGMLKRAIQGFEKSLSEEFILETRMAHVFTINFSEYLEKEKSSATKRWCQDVVKKLQKLDLKNMPRQKKLNLKEGDEGFDPTYKEKVKAENIKEFRKIFYNVTVFDNKFFGLPVKFTPSQKAAVNQVKAELNALCNPDNFIHKA